MGRKKTATAAAEAPTEELLQLDELKLDPDQVRVHGEKNVAAAERAIREVGWGEAGVIDEEGTILVGNVRTEGAKRAGITKARIIETDGTEAIFIRRRGLTAAQKKQLALASNRVAEMADGWDAEKLARMVREDGLELGELWTEKELARLFADEVNPAAQIAAETGTDDTTTVLPTDPEGYVRQIDLFFNQTQLATWQAACDALEQRASGLDRSRVVLKALRAVAERGETVTA